MTYSEETLKRVKAFGMVQYPIDKIVSILEPESPEQFIVDIKDPDTVLHTMYQSGLNSGRFRLDVEGFKLAEIEAQTAKLDYDNELKYLELRKKLFGV